MYKNALISVSDKSGLVEFVKPLVDKGLRVVSTGGTARVLREAGISVVDVSEQTGFAEVMDGRVKTLHPNVHMALLAREGHEGDRQQLSQFDLQPFDLVIGNLYPFEEGVGSATESEQIELIDIGGPSFLRAAAKSFERITVLCDPDDYEPAAGGTDLSMRRQLAAKIFAHTASYDSMISRTLLSKENESQKSDLSSNQSSKWLGLGGACHARLRYGENPQQTATWYRTRGELSGLHDAEVLQGKALSYNNLLDLDAAVRCLQDLPVHSAVAVKHTNPCGIGVGESLLQSVQLALAADPVSVFGGIIAIGGRIDESIAKNLTELFVECIVAEDVDESAQQVFAAKKNLRILKWPGLREARFSGVEVRTVLGGFLAQSSDACGVDELKELDFKCLPSHCKVPPLWVPKAAGLAWKACLHLKSNAIAIAAETQTVGMGMGQVNRVDAVAQAISRMREFHPQVQDVVLASDAFFPFPDSIERIAEAGIQWVIQPGGSIKDQDVIKRAQELNVGLIFTGVRHFKH